MLANPSLQPPSSQGLPRASLCFYLPSVPCRSTAAPTLSLHKLLCLGTVSVFPCDPHLLPTICSLGKSSSRPASPVSLTWQRPRSSAGSSLFSFRKCCLREQPEVSLLPFQRHRHGLGLPIKESHLSSINFTTHQHVCLSCS